MPKAPKKKCKACGGTGVSSRGLTCVCRITAKKEVKETKKKKYVIKKRKKR